MLPFDVEDARIARKVTGTPDRRHHVVNLRTPEEIDAQVREWLQAAYDAAVWQT